MRVADIMTTRVVVATPEMTIGELAHLMVRQGLSGLPVLDGGRLVGMVTELDLIAPQSDPDQPSFFALYGGYVALAEEDIEEEVRQILSTTAAELMTTTVYSIRADATVEELATLIYEREVNPVPVLNAQRRLVGIVSRTDLIRLMTRDEDDE